MNKKLIEKIKRQKNKPYTKIQVKGKEVECDFLSVLLNLNEITK